MKVMEDKCFELKSSVKSCPILFYCLFDSFLTLFLCKQTGYKLNKKKVLIIFKIIKKYIFSN